MNSILVLIAELHATDCCYILCESPFIVSILKTGNNSTILQVKKACYDTVLQMPDYLLFLCINK